VTHEGSPIDGNAGIADSTETLRDMKGRAPTITCNHRGNTHTHVILCQRFWVEVVRMRMNIDEAGSYNQAGGVDRICGLRVAELADFDDDSIPDTHIGVETGSPASVNYRAVANDQIKRILRR
jgi:hypothetical protein